MTVIFQTTILNALSWKKLYEFWIIILLKFVPKGSINNIPVLFQTIAWHQPGDKPLSEKHNGVVYWRTYASLGLNQLRNFREVYLFTECVASNLQLRTMLHFPFYVINVTSNPVWHAPEKKMKFWQIMTRCEWLNWYQSQAKGLSADKGLFSFSNVIPLVRLHYKGLQFCVTGVSWYL